MSGISRTDAQPLIKVPVQKLKPVKKSKAKKARARTKQGGKKK